MIALWGVAIALLLPSSSIAMAPTTRTLTSRPPSPPPSRRRSARFLAPGEGTSCVDSGSGSGSSIPPTKRTKSTAAASATPPRPKADSGAMPPLLALGKLARGTLLKRPSAAIRSPYVADVALHLANGNQPASSTVLAHAPALDVGGMCAAGSEVYLTQRDGGGKTSHAIELVRGAPLLGAASSKGVLVGAHPRLGEVIAEEVLRRGLLREALTLRNGFVVGPVNGGTTKSGSPKKPRAKKAKTDAGIGDGDELLNAGTTLDGASPKTKIDLRRQVTLGDSRVDFQMTLTRSDASQSKPPLVHDVLVEVKNVVCADYQAGTEPEITGPGHCVVVAPPPTTKSDEGRESAYQRAALFPWGRTRGQDFEGRKVVSKRACKHLRNLQSQLSQDVTPVVLFVVDRSDCESVRACREKCPVFAEVLEETVEAGVKALAVRVRWTEEGECFFDGVVPVTV